MGMRLLKNRVFHSTLCMLSVIAFTVISYIRRKMGCAHNDVG